LLCPACARRRPDFDRARAVLAYDDHSRALLLRLKHGDRLDGVPAFGQWLARAGAAFLGASGFTAARALAPLAPDRAAL
jgi:predicted amidophosphoribosyltransferase